MISKIRKYQNSWLTKAILALTALSFMSLFGISGYVSSAGKNRAVIKVDNMEILQDEMNVKLQENIRKTQNMFGDAVTVDDEMRKDILAGLVKQNLTDMIIAREAQKENVSISDELIQQIISSQPEFMDASGRFSPELLRRQLSYFDMSEQEYINDLRQSILSRHLVSSPVEGIIFPQFMNRYVTRIENQQKIFDYISVNPASLKIDRDISDEEIEQYYEDFAPQFEEAEKRDVSFIELKIADLTRNITPSDDEIKAFYQDNIADYVIPEKRHVLQMVFDRQEDADKAMAALNAGGDFYNVARDIAKQSREDTDFGEVSKDMLIADISDAVFDLKKGETAGPVKSELGWHIMKVTAIIPQKETKLNSAKTQIIDTIRQERAYDEAAEVIAEIEDKLGGGATLDEVASEYGVKIHKITGFGEDGQAAQIASSFKKTAASADFIDTAFSYNSGEVSQVLEEDDGFYIIRVDAIHDAHLKDMDEVRPQIQKLWADSEKNAIAQEIVNDVMHDLENGDGIESAARRFNLSLKTTLPLKKDGSFAGLSPQQMKEMFQERSGMPKLVNQGGNMIIAVPVRTIRADANISAEETEALRSQMQSDMAQVTANELADAYASNHDVKIEYKQLGLAD